MVTPSGENQVSRSVRVYGLVQGVGFRPFLHRIAETHGITGWAMNANDCVHIRAEGPLTHIEQFITDIGQSAPVLSDIRDVIVEEAELQGFAEFAIRESTDLSHDVTQVSPDIATCDDCLSDMRVQPNRLNYAFTNCTNCGPRFTIVEDLPYDRSRTTMSSFSLCASCEKEYNDIDDRRYHAQPNACSVCGPTYTLYQSGKDPVTHPEQIIDNAALLIDTGKILGLKGIGGFHLACDAGNPDSVVRLRERKLREGKPFAVMARNVDACRQVCELLPEELDQISSPRRPIVLLHLKGQVHAIAEAVTTGLDTLGIMLPYAPIHHVLFEQLHTDFIVLTSGNVTDEPIAIEDAQARSELSRIADAFLCTNRPIKNRADDSVLFIGAGIPRFLRRSRGWVPQPIQSHLSIDKVIAVGAELKNSFALGKGNQIILSQHIGDLKNPETYEFFLESLDRLTHLFRVDPERIVCDLHPDYLSTRYAENTGYPVTHVQHHYAHIASCIAETGETERVIGVSFDGTGYGEDGNIWGSEFLVCDLLGYERKLHLDYIPLPGGDAATLEPWRMVVSYLYRAYGLDFINSNHPFLSQTDTAEIELLCGALSAGINCPLTSSMGRLFDTVAAITGVAHRITYEAEGPMRLQAFADPSVNDVYPFSIGDTIDPWPCVNSVIEDTAIGVETSVISARFHNTVVAMIAEGVQKISGETGITNVYLSGGVFQNRIVLEKSLKKLSDAGLVPYSNQIVPANDGGISLGQIAVAAART